MTMGVSNQEDITILNVYASIYKKQNRTTGRKGHIYNDSWTFKQLSFNYQTNRKW